MSFNRTGPCFITSRQQLSTFNTTVATLVEFSFVKLLNVATINVGSGVEQIFYSAVLCHATLHSTAKEATKQGSGLVSNCNSQHVKGVPCCSWCFFDLTTAKSKGTARFQFNLCQHCIVAVTIFTPKSSFQITHLESKMFLHCQRSNKKVVLLNISRHGRDFRTNRTIIHLHSSLDLHLADVTMR